MEAADFVIRGPEFNHCGSSRNGLHLLQLRPELLEIALELHPELLEIALGLPNDSACTAGSSSKDAECTRVFADKGYEPRVVSLANYRHNYECNNYILTIRCS
jgi:hypothetical protein